MTPVLHQAGCIALDGRGIVIEGPPGSGKTSLALALIDRGAMLVGDDGIQLFEKKNGLWAQAAPATAGLLEIRNVGIVTLEHVSAPVCLRIVLDDQAPRYVGKVAAPDWHDHPVPLLHMFPDTAALPLRVIHALRLHGLP